MKNLFIAVMIVIASQCQAATIINKVSESKTVTFSTSTWTELSVTNYVSRRLGFVVSNPNSNTDSFAVVCVTNGDSSPDISIRPIEILPGSTPLIPCGASLDIYIL